MEKSPAQNLCDVLYALTIQVKYMENLIMEHTKDMRTDEDFSMRFQGQAELFCKNLKQIKPISEDLIKEGFAIIENAYPKCSNTESEVLITESKGVDNE